MRIRILTDRCTATGLCTTIAPGIFSLRHGTAVADVDRAAGAALERAKEAAASCPYDAIELEPEREPEPDERGRDAR